MAKKVIGIWLAFILICWSGAACANEVSENIAPNSLAIGLSLGRISWDQDEVRYSGEFSGNKLYNVSGFNVRIGYNFTGILGLEFSAGRYQNAIEGDTPLLGDAETVDFSGNIIIHMLRGNFVPYLSGGYGVFAVPTEDSMNDIRGAFNFGGGIKLFLFMKEDPDNRLAFRFDVRNFVVGLDDAVGIDSLNILQFTVGLEFFRLFGGK